jgi:hypothetical protein
MKYYAQYDSFIESHSRTMDMPSFGFANMKKAVAFSTKEKMETFIKRHSFDLTCRRISRRDAFKMAECGDNGCNRVLPLDGTLEDCTSFVVVSGREY